MFNLNVKSDKTVMFHLPSSRYQDDTRVILKVLRTGLYSMFKKIIHSNFDLLAIVPIFFL